MAQITETVLDTTANKKWRLLAVKKTTSYRSSLHFKITNGEISYRPIVKRLNRKVWQVAYGSEK